MWNGSWRRSSSRPCSVPSGHPLLRLRVYCSAAQAQARAPRGPQAARSARHCSQRWLPPSSQHRLSLCSSPWTSPTYWGSLSARSLWRSLPACLLQNFRRSSPPRPGLPCVLSPLPFARSAPLLSVQSRIPLAAPHSVTLWPQCRGSMPLRMRFLIAPQIVTQIGLRTSQRAILLVVPRLRWPTSIPCRSHHSPRRTVLLPGLLPVPRSWSRWAQRPWWRRWREGSWHSCP